MASDGSEKKGMKCLSFQEPYATEIVTGIKTVECRSRKIKAPIKDLVVCASKTAKIFYPIEGLVYGYAIGMVDVVDCVPFEKKHLKQAAMADMPEDGSFAWILENPRMIVPQKVKASASFFYTDFEPEVIETSREAYEKYMLPIAFDQGDKDIIESVVHDFFEDPDSVRDSFA